MTEFLLKYLNHQQVFVLFVGVVQIVLQIGVYVFLEYSSRRDNRKELDARENEGICKDVLDD